MDNLLKSVLKRITPSDSEKHKTQGFIQNVMRVSEGIIEPMGLKQVLAGSYMRDTWMKDKKEFDLFIMFPENTTREMLEKNGMEVGKKLVTALKGRYEIAYAEHPYVRSEVGEYQIDIVPCYHLESAEKIKSAVDRTPFHNHWLTRHLDKSLVGDVRLFKQFVKSASLYGSDTRTSGLSGYLCELLIIHYGSFKKLIKGISEWEPGKVFIDIAGKRDYKSLDNQLKNRFIGQPLILIDPVDKNRNVAAAFSYKNFMDLVYHAGYFLKTPTSSYFSISREKAKLGELNKLVRHRDTCIYCVIFKRPDVIDDILWPQLRKSSRRITDILKDAEFDVMNHDVHADEKLCFILLELSMEKLPRIRKLRGPPVNISDRSKEFINKYKNKRIWVENNYWVAEIERKFTHAKDKISHTLSHKPKEMQEMGIGSHISKEIGSRFYIKTYAELAQLAKNNNGLGLFLEDFFKKRIVR